MAPFEENAPSMSESNRHTDTDLTVAAGTPQPSPCPICGGAAVYVGLKFYVFNGSAADKYRCANDHRWEVAHA
jgi:hypothetical protein